MHNVKPLVEVGVSFIFADENEKIPGRISFAYKRIHIPTDTIACRNIQVNNLTEGLILVNHWNKNNDWKYDALDC